MKRCLRSVLGLGLAVMLLLTTAAMASDPAAASSQVTDPLMQVLITKGVITAEEARTIGSGNTAEQRDALMLLLKEKGVITATEFETLRTPPSASKQVSQALVASVAPVLPPATAQKTEPAKAPPAPAVIPAIAPIRVLQLEGAKPGGLIPDIKLGSKANLKLYGFFKASVVYDTSSPGGNDFPLPGFLGDTGPDGSPEFHIKARAARVGANFEWPDVISPKLALTGRMEFDFEGNFTRANNRNISSIRSSQPSLRLAWARMDYKTTPNTNLFALFGQDWTPFGSSTLPNLVETTGLGISYGSLYTRVPQIRVGLDHNFGGGRNFHLAPEVAVVLPAFGNLPAIGDQLAFGERQGADSEKPQIEGRLVAQFQLDKAKGVAPAQIIVSGMQGWRRSIVTTAGVPCVGAVAVCPAGTPAAAFRGAFPNGATVETDRHGLSGEIQLPTRYVTFLAKYWNGTDLRWYFAGELFSHYNNTLGLTSVTTALSIDGSDTVAFGLSGTTPVIAPQRSVRAQGGFINLGFPLSRIFNANPAGRNAGWTMYLHYGYDSAFANDVRRVQGNFTSVGGTTRNKSDMGAANLQWKINPFVTFAYEMSYYRTRDLGSAALGTGQLFRGVNARSWHNLRSEFATIFTF